VAGGDGGCGRGRRSRTGTEVADGDGGRGRGRRSRTGTEVAGGDGGRGRGRRSPGTSVPVYDSGNGRHGTARVPDRGVPRADRRPEPALPRGPRPRLRTRRAARRRSADRRPRRTALPCLARGVRRRVARPVLLAAGGVRPVRVGR